MECEDRRPVLAADGCKRLAHIESDICFRNRVFEYDTVVAVVPVPRRARDDATYEREDAGWVGFVLHHVLEEQVGFPVCRRDGVWSEVIGELVCESAYFAVVLVERIGASAWRVQPVVCRWCMWRRGIGADELADDLSCDGQFGVLLPDGLLVVGFDDRRPLDVPRNGNVGAPCDVREPLERLVEFVDDLVVRGPWNSEHVDLERIGYVDEGAFFSEQHEDVGHGRLWRWRRCCVGPENPARDVFFGGVVPVDDRRVHDRS